MQSVWGIFCTGLLQEGVRTSSRNHADVQPYVGRVRRSGWARKRVAVVRVHSITWSLRRGLQVIEGIVGT